MSTIVRVDSSTQRIVVDPATSAVSIVHAGPVGPRGYSGDNVIPESIVQSETINWMTPITQEEWDALPTPRDSTILYVIGDF